MNRPRLIRCPICGGSGRTDTAWESARIDGKYGTKAVCRMCGAKTPVCKNANDAISEWNEGNISRNGMSLRLNLFDFSG